jgi:hypothetical protein
VCEISSQSDEFLKSYRVNGRPDTLTDSIEYSLFEYTKTAINRQFLNNFEDRACFTLLRKKKEAERIAKKMNYGVL